MKKVILLHNPNAGEETHEEEELMRLASEAGFEPEYRSLKSNGWKKGLCKADVIIVAGGDGSVRKVAGAVLGKDSVNPPAIAVLPFGTANNISKTVNESQEFEAITRSWASGHSRPFDIGWVRGPLKKQFFIEGLGFGVFPALVSAMKIIDEALSDEPEKRIDTALGLLGGIIRSYKAKPCNITIDGKDYSGNYLMVEVMNICSIGPNLMLAADCKPGDGQLHVVMVPDSERERLLEYVGSRIKGAQSPAALPSVTGSNITLSTEERKLHIDDMLIKTSGNVQLNISLEKERLRFLA